ncbi:hypothetical protein ACPF04_06770 [Campylobacter sp. MOP51]|uniref:hypothetical protein n=1 Tax=Campylobacter canis TaxID=3378588 RepID=UPI003C41E902
MTSSLIIMLVFCAGITLLLVRYHQVTTKLSLEKRWELVNLIKEIEANEEYGEDFKELFYAMFTESVDKNMFPSIAWFTIKMLLTDKKGFYDRRDSFVARINNNKKELEVYKKGLSITLRTNIFAAPHWYIFLAIISIIFAIAVLIVGTISEKTIKVFKKIDKTLDGTLAMGMLRA